MSDNLKILFVSSEVDPFAKTGGLADVTMALPKELISMGHDVRIVVPNYKKISTEMNFVKGFSIWVGSRYEHTGIQEKKISIKKDTSSNNLTLYFIDSFYYFKRDAMYGYGDDGERFAFFCKATLEMLPKIDFKPDIIHCNDWHTGPICMLLKENYFYRSDEFYNDIKTIFTIHNLNYQGNFPRDIKFLFGVGDEVMIPDKVELYGEFSYMKAGIAYADIINTVSKEYSKEIQTYYYGEKLDGLLRKRADDLYGIVNGINTEFFNPETDKKIYHNYSISNLDGKHLNKSELQNEMNLPQKNVPVIGLISRLTEQKGINLIMEKVDELINNDVQLIILGSGDEDFQNGFQYFRDKYPEKISIYLGFNEILANKIYAGSDMFLMPSRYEPCGLGQLISFRYGTIPIARATGGLADTVIDYDGNKTNGNGFTFHDFVSGDMYYAIYRALRIYNKFPEEWLKLVKRVMSLDYSWAESAKEYIKLYKILLKNEINCQ